MTPRIITAFSVLALAGLAGACAADNNAALSTASVAADPSAQASKVDPACVSLASQIDALRNEGVVEKLEKASTGKSTNVQIKRASLAKQSELNKAYAAFQAKCGPKIPVSHTAQAAPAAGQVATTAAAAAVSDKAAASAASTAQTAAPATKN